jgi:hypothetical protein
MPEDPDDRVCSTLCWKDVVLPTQVTTADLDSLIFSELEQEWLKVARIVAHVGRLCEARAFPISHEIIAARIRELEQIRKIDSKGNLSMWRHSEVRLKES